VTLENSDAEAPVRASARTTERLYMVMAVEEMGWIQWNGPVFQELAVAI
jgi:hypothetical protein